VLAAACAALPLGAHAAGDGAALYAGCAACHGGQGQGDPKSGAPNVGGLEAAYVERQLRHFAEGRRGASAQDAYGARMRAAVQALAGPEQQHAVAAYVASLPASASTAAAPKGDLTAGRNYFNAICSACHGSDGKGNSVLSAPRLAGSDPQYLLRQLAAFRSGARGSDPADKYGAQMRKMVLTLPGPGSDQDVVAYIAALAAPGGRIALSDQCAPALELRGGVCRLRTPYLRYASLMGAGVGGLKTGLPPVRDGFTPQQIDLGRYLFFDPVLSRDGTVACASCHDPDHGFSDGRARSIGVGGQETLRNAPTLWNVAFLRRLFWDGRAHSLEEQAQGPLYGAREMGNSAPALAQRLNAIADYRRLFAAAFDDAAAGIRSDHVYRALAAFESSLVSLNSRYDLYAQGVADALSPGEIEGLNVFRSFVARCAECHTPPLFTNQQIAVIGTPEPAGRAFDAGSQAVSGEARLRGGFKVPSLRNIALTAPYEHSGRFARLRDAVEFYNRGRGHAVPPGEKLALHWHIGEPRLSEREIDRLVDFLGALTDESFKPQRPAALPSGLRAPG
jgi:cytochrome c peroxidase